MKIRELEYALTWITTNTADTEETQLCFEQLGIANVFGEVDQERVILISGYIWKQHPKTPNFAKLLTWLQKNYPRKQ